MGQEPGQPMRGVHPGEGGSGEAWGWARPRRKPRLHGEHLGRWNIIRELETQALGWERATEGRTPGAVVGRVSGRGRILQGGQPG